MGNINYLCIVGFLLFISCSSDDDVDGVQIETLADLVNQNEIVIDNVIACASGSENDNEIITYLYPRPGATEIRYFETENATVTKDDYDNYSFVDLPLEDLFNGYLKKFTRQTQEEKWVIVTFREPCPELASGSGKIHLSNPIRLKHQTQKTIFGDAISIDQDISGEPLFSWSPIVSSEDAIYFQVVSDASDALISGTYTYESQFQFYNLDNVVLNITDGTPENLMAGAPYDFTLMAVSEDNWVNYLTLKKSFIAE